MASSKDPHTGTSETSTITAHSTDDFSISSPYYVHTNEATNTSLVSQLLSSTGVNYHLWKKAVILVLDAKNKSSFIDGTIHPPSLDSPLRPQWKCVNSLIKSWIINSVAPDIASSLLFALEIRNGPFQDFSSALGRM